MFFHPFGRAEQARFLSVPTGIDNSPFWPPAALVQFTQGSCLLHPDHHNYNSISVSKDPCVMVITAHHPLIRKFRTLQLRNHVIEGYQLPVEFEFQMYSIGAGAEVIGER